MAEDDVGRAFTRGRSERALDAHTDAAAALAWVDQREALVLRIWGGLTFTAIARTLDENMNTVAGRYRTALTKLRHLLPEACHDTT